MTFRYCKLSVIIPTRNRPQDLRVALTSLFVQTRLPDELVIVDQSKDNLSKISLESTLPKGDLLKVIYIHNSKISGLVEAKNVGVSFSTGEIVCFLEDDVELEMDYLSEIESSFSLNPSMVGCCGVVTNPPTQSKIYFFFFKLFHLGIFKDDRITYHGKLKMPPNCLVPSDKLSGGISAWRKDVFKHIPFDEINGFHMFEDIDFSTRVARYYGKRLFVNPNARLAHHCSPINRDILDVRQRRKLRECFTYYKKRKDWPNATISFIWLLLGMLLESIFQSFSNLSFKPIQGYFLGVSDGFAKKIIS